MKLQKIKIEINFLGKSTIQQELIVDLLELKFKKIKLDKLDNDIYLLKGMDKHRHNFINELVYKKVLTLTYNISNETEYFLRGFISM